MQEKLNNHMEEKYIAAIDLGTVKIALLVARVGGDNVQVVFYRQKESRGIRNSNVFNPKQASDPVRELVREAEQELNIVLNWVVVGLPRYSVAQETATGELVRVNPDDYISREEIEALKEQALSSYPLSDSSQQSIYGAVAQSFSTDDHIQFVEDEIIGTLSPKVEGNFKIFIGKRNAETAIDKLFNGLDLAISKKYFLPDVVAKTVLLDEEKQNGVALVDIGGGVTSVAVYHGGLMRHYAAIPFGGKSVTTDIRTECSIDERLAENIKLAYGACMPSRLANLSEKTIQIRYENSTYKEVTVKYLSEIIDARYREIIDAILYEIQCSGFSDFLRSGIVVTGGGALMTNFPTLLKDISGYSVRTGYPRFLFSASGCTGLYDPSATSAIGMVLAAKDDCLPDCATAPMVMYAENEQEPQTEPVSEVYTEGSEGAWETAETVGAGENMAITDDELNHGTTGTLIPENEFGEKKQKVKPQKAPRQPRQGLFSRGKKQEDNTEQKPENGLLVLWKKINDTIDKAYTSVTDEKI